MSHFKTSFEDRVFEAPRHSSAFAAQIRVIGALILREMRIKSAHSRLSYLLTLAEPMMQIGLMMSVFTATGRRPDFGTSMLLFLLTGVTPYFLFTHVSGRTMGAVRSNGLARALQLVQPIDIIIARALLEIGTLTVVAALLFTLLYLLGVTGAIPCFPMTMIFGYAATALLATGVGLINGVVGAFYRVWAVIYAVFSRSLIFLCGVFYVPDYMPQQMRFWLSWNPVLHCLEWFRTAFYPNYPTLTLDRTYLLGFGVTSLLIGLAMERTLRSRLI